MKIVLSEHAGFCPGVKRAVELIEKEIEKNNKKIYTLGNIIHNESFNKSLEDRGVINISESDLSENFSEDSLVFIRTHGIGKSTAEMLSEKNISFIDATCPFVKKIHNIVTAETEKADESGEKIAFILLGDKNHPEVLGIVSFAGKYPVKVVSGIDELAEYEKKCDSSIRHIILSQTTHSLAEWEKCLISAKSFFEKLTVYSTICSVTEARQSDAESLSAASDLMVVIGGKNSSNTKKLAEVCKKGCKTVFISTASEINKNMFSKEMTVGVTAGASTPDGIIKEVIQTMSEINTEMSFAEMLEQSFKTIRTGEEVTGVVSGVFANEVQVDLGIKQTGILPASEVCEKEQNLAESFKLNDKITVKVKKFNDAEGTVLLSKKEIDLRANWLKVENAKESGEVLKGKMVSAVKGGALLSVEGQNVFIPAKLMGLAKDEAIEDQVGKEFDFKVIETDPSRKRAVGSVYAVIREKKDALSKEFWDAIEVDKVYTGKVKSLTSYGAFVDLGGVDGMVHITELSWQKIKNPAEVVSIGDEITVYVKEFDPEAKKISLGYKTESENPWNLIKDQYQSGDTAKVKIVNITPFGAFAELIPGIDGLIHISQLSDKRVSNPNEVVKVGDEVEVKVVDINYDTKKVSLSMRALIEENKAAEEEKIREENAQYMVSEEAPAEEAPAEEASEAPAEENKDAE